MEKFRRSKWLDPQTWLDVMDGDERTRAMNHIIEEQYADMWRQNIEANEKHFLKGKWAYRSLYGSFTKGGPCFVLGAGPSLKRELKTVESAYRMHKPIIAVDRAFQQLRRIGTYVRPQLIVCLDGQETVAGFIEGVDKHSVVAISICCHPSVYEAAKRGGAQVVWYGPIQVFSEFWKEMYAKYGEWIATTRVSDTVYYSAVDMAIWMGFTDIVALGVDLCWPDEESARADGHDKTIELESGHRTCQAFLLSAGALPAFPHFHPNVAFRNLSGGVQMPGWIPSTAIVRNNEAVSA